MITLSRVLKINNISTGISLKVLRIFVHFFSSLFSVLLLLWSSFSYLTLRGIELPLKQWPFPSWKTTREKVILPGHICCFFPYKLRCGIKLHGCRYIFLSRIWNLVNVMEANVSFQIKTEYRSTKQTSFSVWPLSGTRNRIVIINFCRSESMITRKRYTSYIQCALLIIQFTHVCIYDVEIQICTFH